MRACYNPPVGNSEIEERRTKAVGSLIMRIAATGAIWSIVVVIGWRLRHPTIRLTLIGVAIAVSLLIWTHKSKDK